MSDKKVKLNEARKIASIKEMLDLAAKEDGEKIAFQYKDENNKENIIQVTYKEFKDDTEELGTALASVGMQDKHIIVFKNEEKDIINSIIELWN